VASAYAFGPFTLDVEEKTLRSGGASVPVTPKVFDTLAILVGHSGQLMSKDQLMKEVWPDTFVDEATLAQNISVLRKALGDRAEQSIYVETVPKRGYRFIAPVSRVGAVPPVEAQPPAPVVTPAQARPQVSRRLALWIGTAATVVAISGGWAYSQLGSQGPSVPAVQPKILLAVLPFANFSADPADEYIADGMTEELTAQLGGLQPDRLGVIARTSAMHFKGRRDLVIDIGRQLGVQYVIEGSVRREGMGLRVSVQLIDVRDETHTWAETFDHRVDDLLKMQLDVAQSVTHRIQSRLSLPATEVRLRAGTANPRAYQLYARASHFWNQRQPDSAVKAVALYQQAIDLDPAYAQAYADMSRCYLSFAAPTPRESYLKAQAAARSALAIDDSLADAHFALATAALHLFDWATATGEFRRAEALNPLLRNYDYSVILGQFDDAIAETRRGIAIDPANFLVHHGLAVNLFYARRYAEAVDQFRDAVDLNPAHVFSSVRLGQTYGQLGQYEAAITLLKSTGLAGLGSLAYVYGVSGRTLEAAAVVRQLERSSTGNEPPVLDLAIAYTGLGDKDSAFQWLTRAHEQLAYQLIYLQVDPRFDALRQDPRYDGLVRRIGFPPMLPK
jgi:TolB-like protein/DNA-binding winged helix-turn-helix (wHTH) protein